MNLGLIGLGTMGGPMLRRLHQAGHVAVGFDVDDEARTAVCDEVPTAASITELIEALPRPRTVWLMLPAGTATDSTIETLCGLLAERDLVVDGGNSDFRDAPGHAARLGGLGVSFCDVGVSGGRWGWKTGYGLMVGGSAADVERIEPALRSLAAPGGCAHVGPVGSGHLVKAIHNGIQYAIMQSYAEGYALLSAHQAVDALAAMRVYQNGCSIRSFLLEQMVAALQQNPALHDVPSVVADSGMGRWTAEEALRLAVPTPTLNSALQARFTSRDGGTAFRVLNLSRTQVGGQHS